MKVKEQKSIKYKLCMMSKCRISCLILSAQFPDEIRGVILSIYHGISALHY